LDEERNLNKHFPPALWAALIGVVILLIGAMLAYTQYLVQLKNDQAETLQVLQIVEQNFQYAIREVNSIAFLLAQTNDEHGEVSNFDKVAAELMEKYPTINMLEIIKDGIVTHVYPLRGHEAILGYDLYQNKRIETELFKTAHNGSIHFSGPSMLVEDKLGVIGLHPFNVIGEEIKLSAVILYLETLIDQSQISNFSDKYYFQLSKINLANGEEEFLLENEVEMEWADQASIQIDVSDWKLYAAKIDNYTTLIYFFSICFISLIIATICGYLSFKLFQKPFELEQLLTAQSKELLNSREQFKKSSELLTSVLESPQNIVIFSLDRFYNFIAFNEIYRNLTEEIFGVPIRVGMNVFDVVPKKDRALLMVNYNRALNGESFDFIQEFAGQDLKIHLWQSWFSPIRDKSNDIIGLTVFSIDITKRISAEKDLKRNEERLRTLISNSPYCIHELDVEGRIISINTAGVRMFSLDSQNQLIGRYYPVLIGKKHATLVDDLFTRTLLGESTEFEFSSGESQFQALLIPLKNEDEVVIRVMGITQDITERKKSEVFVQNSLKEKTTLLAEIHHRVKNNLAIVSGLLELQKVETDDERLSAIFDQSINRIISIAMVHELMYNTHDLSSVNVHAYLEKLIPAISATMQNRKQNVEFDLNIAEYKLNINQAIPLGLLLNELITNSFKYAFNGSSENRITIKLIAEKKELKVFYHDNGRGFPIDIDFHKPKNLGLNLIHAQLQQLDSSFSADTKEQFELEFQFTATNRGSHSNFS